MIYYKTPEEIQKIRRSALLVSATLAKVASFLKPGMSTLEVDALAEAFILEHGATPSFKNYKGYPNATCISVNDAVVHGIPGAYVLRQGDVVSVDVGVYLDGFHGDSAYTFALAGTDPDCLRLLADTKASLYKGIAKAVAGNRVGDISYAVQQYTELERGYGVVRELVGHGLGKQLHEDPQVPNYGRRGQGPILKEGLVICIEPMINLGSKDVVYEDDGWTVLTKDGSCSAHFEHTVLVRRGRADILSSYEDTEREERANPDLAVAGGF